MINHLIKTSDGYRLNINHLAAYALNKSNPKEIKIDFELITGTVHSFSFSSEEEAEEVLVKIDKFIISPGSLFILNV
jgi:hypothetical protein